MSNNKGENMKTVFKMVAKDTTKTTISVQFEAPRYELTREEVRRYRRKLENRVHDLLRETGYDVSEIKRSRV